MLFITPKLLSVFFAVAREGPRLFEGFVAKRFTDTEKWKDPWFDNLSGVAKLFFYYLIDNVDCAGIWKPNFKHFERNTGFKYSESEAIFDFSEKLKKLDNGNFMLSSFIKFQYGTLKKTSNVYKGVIKSLEYNGLQSNPCLTLDQGLPNPLQGVMDTDTDTHKNKVLVKENIDLINSNKGKNKSPKKEIKKNEVVEELSDLPAEAILEVEKITVVNQKRLIYDYGIEPLKNMIISLADYNFNAPESEKKKNPNLAIRNWFGRNGVQTTSDRDKEAQKAIAPLLELENKRRAELGLPNV